MNALRHPERARLAESVRRACPDMALNCHYYANLGARKCHKPHCVDRDTGCVSIATCDLSGRELVSALHLERGGADLDPQTAGQRQEIGWHFVIVIWPLGNTCDCRTPKRDQKSRSPHRRKINSPGGRRCSQSARSNSGLSSSSCG
jgi:hypothetical protein